MLQILFQYSIRVMKMLNHSILTNVPYSAKFWQGKTLGNRSFQSFGEENVGEFTAIY